LELPEETTRFILEQMRINSIQSLPIQMSHALHVSKLPQHHRDLFDRMLIAQAKLEGLPVLSSDHQLANYQVEVIW
jgi:PIN domain nuclease of toxin-antitoxin system